MSEVQFTDYVKSVDSRRQCSRLQPERILDGDLQSILLDLIMATLMALINVQSSTHHLYTTIHDFLNDCHVWFREEGWPSSSTHR